MGGGGGEEIAQLIPKEFQGHLFFSSKFERGDFTKKKTSQYLLFSNCLLAVFFLKKVVHFVHAKFDLLRFDFVFKFRSNKLAKSAANCALFN